MPGETNYIHEAEIWRQRLKNETEGAAVWHSNWGFLAAREQPEPRGFSENVAKYAYGQGQWSVKSVRVPDNSAEGVAAAQSEQNARKTMSALTWTTQVANEMKPCAAKVRARCRSPAPFAACTPQNHRHSDGSHCVPRRAGHPTRHQ